MSSSLESLFRPRRRRIFVSYHHGGDQGFYELFSAYFCDRLELLTDNSLERAVDSDDHEYVMRRIRENYLTGSSCTVVLCGARTQTRKYVDWEILASLNQGMALVGVLLPSIQFGTNGGTFKPQRLQDNIDSGYAVWVNWADIAANPAALVTAIEGALTRPSRLSVNSAPRMTRNA